jgi:hypothetical protein
MENLLPSKKRKIDFCTRTYKFTGIFQIIGLYIHGLGSFQAICQRWRYMTGLA